MAEVYLVLPECQGQPHLLSFRQARFLESQENCLRMRLHIIVLVTATLMHGFGAKNIIEKKNIIAQWLSKVGITYVPPPPRPGTCRDCSTNSQVSRGKVAKKDAFVGLDNNYYI